MKERNEILEVETISFDRKNPRIRMALQKYGGKLDAERIYFALRSAAEGAQGSSSYNRLRDSIRASKGAQYPITVTIESGDYTCIDGNTRLAIYQQFDKEGVTGDWSKIKAVVMDDADQRDIETIRVSAHLIGAREWPAYEKARYLHYLYSENFMSYEEMVALCGGNRKEIERQIDAYHEMNEHYREKVDDDEKFHIDRYSGFVELQKPRIKEAIFDAGLTLDDFGKWILDGNIFRLESVRLLPQVLGDEDAKKMFLEGGIRSIEDAKKLLEQKAEIDREEKNEDITLETASLYQLAEAFGKRMDGMLYSDVQILRDKEHDETTAQVSALEDLSARLQRLLKDVAE